MLSFVARGRGKHYVMPMIERLSLVSVRTVSRRLASKGYRMQNKLLHFIRIARNVLSAMPCAAAKLTLLVRVLLWHQCPMCALANLL